MDGRTPIAAPSGRAVGARGHTVPSCRCSVDLPRLVIFPLGCRGSPRSSTSSGQCPDFSRHADRNIERGIAYVVVTDDEVLRAALLSPQDRPHQIRWLAVRNVARRSGVGSLLKAAILHHWPTGDIEVVTFAPCISGGAPARHLYERFGFGCWGPVEPAPDGGSREIYVLRR